MDKSKTYFFIAALLAISFFASAQRPVLRGIENIGRGAGNTGGKDSLQHRDKYEDSITISFRYSDSSRPYKLDSSISDFTKRFPIPPHHVYLGNVGNASRSILFAPLMKPGWDDGFHAFDVYKWRLDKVRFFNTTRPYTELGYLLGSRVEQIIEVIHTQNIKPNWNASFQYRLINSAGFFKGQKTNHNNYLLSSWYQGTSKRYNNYIIILTNSIQSSENGGIQDDEDYLNNPNFNNRFDIPTKLGGDAAFGRDFFNTKITTGNRQRESTVLLRQQYDLGRKDSLVTDSTVIPLFYPRLRFEHTIQFNNHSFLYLDNIPDSAYYKNNYGIMLNPVDTVTLNDKWKEILNDFSIYQFPDVNNLQQFIKAGATLQNLQGRLSALTKSFYNFIIHGEYRNKTKNQKWDIEAFGKLYINGLNAGDYQAYGSLQAFVGEKLGYVQLGFENVNRSPSFIFDSRSSYYLDTSKSFNKENTSHIFGSYFLPLLNLRLTGHYYLIGNYTYLVDYYKLQQEASLFNFLQVSLEKLVKIGKSWNWYIDLFLQQKTGNVQVNAPLLFTRLRFAYEGNFGFKNLNIAIGTELRYNTPYKADGYSPVLSKFFYQDSVTIRNLPEINAYLHFRIRSFKAYLRFENLNTARNNNGFGFTNNNLAAPGYPFPGLQTRLGIYWNFVN